MTYMGGRKQLPVVFHLMNFSTASKPRIFREKRDSIRAQAISLNAEELVPTDSDDYHFENPQPFIKYLNQSETSAHREVIRR